MLKVRTDRIIPLTKARQRIGKLVKKVKGNDFFVISKTGIPKVALVDVDYLGKLKELEEKLSWEEKFKRTLENLRAKTDRYPTEQVKQDIKEAILEVRAKKK